MQPHRPDRSVRTIAVNNTVLSTTTHHTCMGSDHGGGAFSLMQCSPNTTPLIQCDCRVWAPSCVVVGWNSSTVCNPVHIVITVIRVILYFFPSLLILQSRSKLHQFFNKDSTKRLVLDYRTSFTSTNKFITQKGVILPLQNKRLTFFLDYCLLSINVGS